MPTRASYFKLNRPAVDALMVVNKHITTLDPKLRALVELRVSQINGCAYCVNMHSNDAHSHGETQQRLDCLCVWWECDFFDDREQAAFRWAESLTDISHTHAPDDVYNALESHFSNEQIVDLTLVISTMNAWNRLAVGHRTRPQKR